MYTRILVAFVTNIRYAGRLSRVLHLAVLELVVKNNLT